MGDDRIPRVGDVVYFFMPDDSLPYAALVTGDGPGPDPHGKLDLAVFDTFGLHFDASVPHVSRGEARSCWDWRSREER